MDYEKEYKKKLDDAKYWHDVSEGDIPAVLEEIFPELREDDNDEKSKKWILEYLYDGLRKSDEQFKAHFKAAIAWLEKQGQVKEYTFKSIPRLLDMIEPSDRAKAYCQKLIDTLAKEGYNADVKIVEGVLKGWNGEDVPMAVMDIEKQVQKKCIDDVTQQEAMDIAVDKVEPKFHEGDWVVDKNGTVQQILSYKNGIYKHTNGYSSKMFEDEWRLWNITKDAKDGDVLFAENFDNIGGCVFLFKGLDSWKFDAEGNRAIATGYCCTSITESSSTDFGIQGPDCVEIERVHPATKEQRGLLFQKMHESGYEWNAEKKELKLLITNGGDFCESENCEQKPAEWSEEDENRFNNLIFLVEHSSENKATKEGFIKFINKLKSLGPQNTWKPSKEQLKFLQHYADQNNYDGTVLTSLLNDLKKL